jgi:Uma2 family endonuclease
VIAVEDYLAGEADGELRHEYLGGQVYAMTDASRAHALIVSNLVASLRPLVRGRGCQLFSNDMQVRLRIADQDLFYYPDLLLSCDPSDRETYCSSRPCVIVEVLSESTERIDRPWKLLAYMTLPSLQDDLLVSQERREVWHYRRSAEWVAAVITEGGLTLACLGMELAVESIYDEVEGID